MTMNEAETRLLGDSQLRAEEWAEKAGVWERKYHKAAHLTAVAIAFTVITLVCMALMAYFTSAEIKQVREDARKGILRESPAAVKYQHNLLLERCDKHVKALTWCLRGRK